MKKTPCVLTIAGSDSSGGAGIQADIKTISALGCYAASVITALTAQNTLGVQAISAISPDFVAQQLESVLSDLSVVAIKIGMLYDEKVMAAVLATLQKFSCRKIVLDPVMFSKNGCELLNPSAMSFLKENILSHVMLLTPNLPEAEKLLGWRIESQSDQAQAAKELGETFAINVLVKGGHSTSEDAADVLYRKEDAKMRWFNAPRISSQNTHGTGCTLSSAIAAYLAKDYPLIEAIQAAKNYLTAALDCGKDQRIGKGCGPVDHFYFLEGEVYSE